MIINDKLSAALLCLSVVPAGTANCAVEQKKEERPNILCIVTEDISPYLACYGDPVAKTPNLDKFATQAIRYTNMHTTVGVSAPSRFELITGMYASALGANYMRNMPTAPQYLPEGITPYEVVPPAGIKTYTEYMRAAGYYCTNNSKTDFQFNPTPSMFDESSDSATWKNCPEGQPFLAIFNINTTHEGQIWERDDEPLEIQPEDIDMSRFPYFPDDPVIRHDLARLYTNIAIMDRESQAFIDDLEASGKMDNTIIIWYSDNGGPMPRAKRSIYNPGTLVPLMIKYPNGYRAGEVDDRLCMFIDIPATILSLAGIQPPAYMQGEALLGKYQQPERDYVFAVRDRFDEVVDKCAGVRDHQFQYIRNYMPERSNYLENSYRMQMPMMQRLLEMHEAGELNEVQELYFKAPRPVEEFYDILQDPYNLNNLIDDPRYANDIERLREVFDEWNSTVNANWARPETEWMNIQWPGGVQPVVANPTAKRTSEGWEVSCATPGASIVYVVNYTPPKKVQGNSTPSIPWKLYTGPIKLNEGDKLMVLACRAGCKSSEQVSIVK